MSLPVNKVSTADLVAAARAWHLKRGTAVFEDPYAARLCGWVLQLALRFSPFEWLLFELALRPVMPVTMCVIMRARFAEDCLEEAVASGTRQYVILGAGMDSFAFRRPDLMEHIHVFEVDHPVTQARKLKRLKRAGLAISPNHHFVAADLSQVSALEALEASPFDPSRRSFLSLLGVAYYLTESNLAATARSIADGLPRGSRIVFDYLLDTESSDARHMGLRKDMLDFVSKRGEPMRSEYSLAGMKRLMEAEGFAAVDSFAMTDLAEQYCERFGEPRFEFPGIFGFGNFEVASGGA